MIKTFFFSLLFSITTVAIFAQDQQADLQTMRVDVIYLASDYLEGRELGKNGEALAAQYIISRYEEAGLQPMGIGGTYLQPFPVQYTINPHGGDAETRVGNNVVGYLDNQATYTVIIGAHYDHLGYGQFGSLNRTEPAIHNGADDNASGVSAMLWLAEKLKHSDYKHFNYLFIAFSGEELGLHGSRYFANNPTIPMESMSCMLNMDMVGALNESGALTVNGVGTSSVWREALNAAKAPSIKSLNMTESGVGPSDHTSFYTKDIPAIHFFTGAHSRYHKPDDDSHLINFEGMLSIGQTILNLIRDLDASQKLPFSKTKDEKKQERMSFKVTLGVMPDYGFTGKGMRIEAIIEDRPAQKAGIENGDVVIQIGDMEIADIYAYMEALSKHKKGDTVKVKVKRGKKELDRQVTF